MEPSSSQSTLPAIEMHDVAVGSLRDQSLTILEGINWRVAPGDYWVIAGLQGSGKSDFLMMTASLMPPTAGVYKLFGELMPIFDEPRLKKRLRLGLAFETGQLFNHLTVAENIALPLRYHGNLPQAEANAQVQPILEAMELAPWADSTPGAIGRNWQKRVGLARALVLKPEVLLVDSPLTGLDLRHANWWLSFLDALSRGLGLLEGRPLTLIVTAADLRPWKGRARQFAVLKNKRFSVLGDWSQLESVTDELVQELLTA
jgi:ABC-type transporter Mla maintaining outer membrane lipid asymmetry ATPase subunit MlaF